MIDYSDVIKYIHKELIPNLHGRLKEAPYTFITETDVQAYLYSELTKRFPSRYSLGFIELSNKNYKEPKFVEGKQQTCAVHCEMPYGYKNGKKVDIMISRGPNKLTVPFAAVGIEIKYEQFTGHKSNKYKILVRKDIKKLSVWDHPILIIIDVHDPFTDHEIEEMMKEGKKGLYVYYFSLDNLRTGKRILRTFRKKH